MSQSQVIKLLEKSKKGLTTKEIKEKLKLGQPTVNATLQKLLKYKEVRREIKFKPSQNYKLPFVYFINNVTTKL